MNPVILDIGSGETKALWVRKETEIEDFYNTRILSEFEYGSRCPFTFRSTVVPINSNRPFLVGLQKIDEHCKQPVDKGIVLEWSQYESILGHAFEGLQGDREYQASQVVMIDSAVDPSLNRPKMTELLFEKFSADALYIDSNANISIYGSSTTTGVVLDIGFMQSRAIPIVDGICLKAVTIEIGGHDVTKSLHKCIERERTTILYESDYPILESSKSCYCFVSKDCTKELEICKKAGRKGHFDDDRKYYSYIESMYLAPEILFEPSNGIHNIVFKAILSVDDHDIQEKLARNIILNGSTTQFEGFKERLEIEVSNLLGGSRAATVSNGGGFKGYTALVNARLITATPEFETLCCTKAQYEEIGSDYFVKHK